MMATTRIVGCGGPPRDDAAGGIATPPASATTAMATLSAPNRLNIEPPLLGPYGLFLNRDKCPVPQLSRSPVGSEPARPVPAQGRPGRRQPPRTRPSLPS